MAIGFNLNQVPVEADPALDEAAERYLAAADAYERSIQATIEFLRKSAERLVETGPTPCEGCKGKGDRPAEVEHEGCIDWFGSRPCDMCNGEGKTLCCVCGEKVAEFQFHWIRTQPGFEGPTIDDLCRECVNRPCYQGGEG